MQTGSVSNSVLIKIAGTRKGILSFLFICVGNAFVSYIYIFHIDCKWLFGNLKENPLI